MVAVSLVVYSTDKPMISLAPFSFAGGQKWDFPIIGKALCKEMVELDIVSRLDVRRIVVERCSSSFGKAAVGGLNNWQRWI